MAKEYDINKYGWPLVHPIVPDEAWHHYEYFYETETNGSGVTYKRLENTNPCVIWRESITTSGGTTNTKLEFSWGDWTNKSSLTYVPINATIHVVVP